MGQGHWRIVGGGDGFRKDAVTKRHKLIEKMSSEGD